MKCHLSKWSIIIIVIAVLLGIGLYGLYHYYQEGKSSLPNYTTSYLTPLSRTDNYLFYANKKGVQMVNISFMKKNGAIDYKVYQDYSKYLCTQSTFIAKNPISPCKTIKIDTLKFVYRDFYTSEDDSYYREYFSKTPDLLVQISVLSQGKFNSDQINRLIQTHLKSLPTFWQVNNPESRYIHALSSIKEWRGAQQNSKTLTTIPSPLQQLLQQTSQQLIQAIQQSSNAFPKDPVIQRFVQDYIDLISQTNKTLLQPNTPSLTTVYTKQVEQLKAKQRLLLTLLIPQINRDDDDVGALTIQLLTYAEETLKKHPNNTDYCIVLTQTINPLAPPSIKKAILIAKKMAFIRVGARYCPQYYGKLSAWGGKSLKKRAPIVGNKTVSDLPKQYQKYYGMSYQKYFEKFVQPLVPKIMVTLKNPKKNKDYCEGRGYFASYRNPLQDAVRQAYILKGKQYCSQKLLKPSPLINGVECLSNCKYLGVLGYPLDCVEKCKDTPGVLFKNLELPSNNPAK